MSHLLNKLFYVSLCLQCSCGKSRIQFEVQNDNTQFSVEKASEPVEHADLREININILDNIGMTKEEFEKAKAKTEDKMDAEDEELVSYTILAKHSGECLQVEEGSVLAGANINQGPCIEKVYQEFYLMESDEEDFFFLVSMNSTQCVTVSTATDNSTNIVQFPCVEAGIQKFKFVDQGDGFVTAINTLSGKCIDLSLGPDYGNAIQWDCHMNANQRFKFTLRESPN